MTITLYELAGAEPDRRFSPFCWRIRMALAHKELPTEGLPWRFTEKERLAPTEQGRVPVIIDNGKWVSDSWMIANYLEETYPERPTLFGGGAARSVTRFVQGWTDTVLHPAIFRLVVLDIWQHVHEKDKIYFRKSREERFGGTTLEILQSGREERLPALRDGLAPLRNLLGAQSFIGGLQPRYADYIAFGAFQWARCISPFKLIEANDPVFAWRERMLDLFGGMAREAKGYPV